MTRQVRFGVIFDMDGVLVDSAAAHMESWRRLAVESFAKSITEAEFRASFGRRSAEIIESWFGVTDQSQIAALDQRKEAIYREIIHGRVPVMPGAMALIESLHEAGYALAVGSSGPPENVKLVYEEMRLGPYLSAVITGRDVASGKPAPDVFLAAADRMSLPPESCLVIEDAPSGIEAARRAGMKSIALAASNGRDQLADAGAVVTRLDQITPAMIRSLIGAESPDHRGTPF